MRKLVAISIPTGIGAEYGGYAGDFGYLARKIARKYDLIINPNAVNGGILSAIQYGMNYLEGYLFDEFFRGTISITPKKPYETNKIGVVFDKSIKENMLNIHLNTINAMKMVKGIEISGIEYTEKPLELGIDIKSGISSGSLKNEDCLLSACEKLIKKGAQAIAIVCNFKDDQEDENYDNAKGIDPIGGLEAIISHLVTKTFMIPAAHAPAFNSVDIAQNIVHSKVSSECISSTYLPCVLEGLAISPEIHPYSEGLVKNKDVECLLVPDSALGSGAVLSCFKNSIKIISIKNNTTLDVTSEKLKINIEETFDSYEQWLKEEKET